MRSVDEKFAALFAVIGTEDDKFRAFWDRADEPTRRMLLTIGKAPTYLSGDPWRDIAASYRGQIRQRATRLRDWLNTALPEAVA